MQNMSCKVSKALQVIKTILQATVNVGWYAADGSKVWGGRKVRIVEANSICFYDVEYSEGRKNYYYRFDVNELTGSNILYAQENQEYMLLANEAIVVFSADGYSSGTVTIYVKRVEDRATLQVAVDAALAAEGSWTHTSRDAYLETLKQCIYQPGMINLYAALIEAYAKEAPTLPPAIEVVEYSVAA